MYRILRCTCALQRLSHKPSVTSQQHFNSGGGVQGEIICEKLIYALSSLQLFLPGVLWLYFLKLLVLPNGHIWGGGYCTSSTLFLAQRGILVSLMLPVSLQEASERRMFKRTIRSSM